MQFRYSLIDTSYRCLEKYNLQYLKNIKSKINDADIEFGNCIHKSIFNGLAIQNNKELNHLLENINYSEMFSLIWEEQKYKDLIYRRYNFDQLKIMGENFISKFFRLHIKKYEPLYLEKQIKFDINDHVFYGTPDFIGIYNGIESIVDFKTSSQAYDRLKLDINEQLYIYAYAANKVLNFKAKQIVYTVFVKDKTNRIQTICKKIDFNNINKMLDNINNQCNLLKSISIYPKNRTNCLIGNKKCEYYTICYEGESKNEEEKN